MLDYINYLLHCPVRISVWFSVCCEPLLVMSLTVTTDRICHAGLSAVRSLDSVPFPSSLPMRAELASGEAECENYPWCCAHDLGSVLTSWKHPLEHPRASLHCFLQYWKRFGVLFAQCCSLTESIKIACVSPSLFQTRGVHPSIHFHGVLPKQKSHSKFCSIDI